MIAIILFGTKGREKTVSRGRFFCPRCRSEATYEKRKATRWFTLYFVPVLPTDTLAEWVRCTTCAGDFELSVLQLSRADIEAATAPWTCSCGNANSAAEACCVRCAAPREVH